MDFVYLNLLCNGCSTGQSPLSPEVEILDLEFFASRRVLKAAAIPATSLNIDPDSLKS